MSQKELSQVDGGFEILVEREYESLKGGIETEDVQAQEQLIILERALDEIIFTWEMRTELLGSSANRELPVLYARKAALTRLRIGS